MSNYDLLNPMQKEAVFWTEGPLLVLAGAGSGKTRVLTHRIAYLIEEKQVNPWNIMAITFTNKAAGEMRDRVDKQVEYGADSVWVSTFHSSCVRILRRHIEFLGYGTNFTIYDTDDQKALMKQIYKSMQIDNRMFKERAVMSRISSAKDELISPDEFLLNAVDFHERKIGEIYQEYQKQLKKNNALDFDDLIVKTVELFQNNPQVLEYYQERFKYIMVDEYQDTNTAQFKLVHLLASKYKNICVVGDDDQSIYKFRGANIGNILNFEDAFPGAKVIKLEQNYRSTQHILDAANSVIRNNRGRKDKTLWTGNGTGEKIQFKQFDQAYEEADFIVKDILAKGYPYEDCAVLYRTNAQSRLLEEKCIAYNVPYRLVGGVNFYQRKEIKDILGYLKTIANGRDDVAVGRIVNVPKRGIGATSISKVTIFASANGYSLYDAMARARVIPGLGKAAEKIGKFTDMIEDFRQRLKAEDYTIRQLIEDVLEETGYRKELEAEDDVEGQSRLENIDELINKAVTYWNDAEHPALDEFLEEVALVADVDSLDQTEARVTLMTLHSAKGLEFENVYLSGLEDGLFPSYMSITSDDRDAVEEERRLCYVGITRAKKNLTLTAARMRMVNGETRYCKCSRFVEEIPEELLKASRLESRLSGSSERRRMEAYIEDGGLPWNQPFGGQAFDGSRSGKPAGVSRFGSKENAYASKTSSYVGGTFGASGAYGGSASSKAATAAGASSRTIAVSGAAAGTAGKPAFGKEFTVAKSRGLDYQVGDRVSHIKFGSGIVQEIKDGTKDYEVTVCFDSAGVKRMFASFAKLKKE